MLQSTLPHGERRRQRQYALSGEKLQSTLPHGKRPWPHRHRARSGAASIHAPARGATRCRTDSPRPSMSFNPRSRTGSDIHDVRGIACRGSFNPRSRTGSDLRFPGSPSGIHGFNPRSRTGSDHQAGVLLQIFQSFNPRSRTGSDFAILSLSLTPMLQSTLPHGERLGAQMYESCKNSASIHAPARGATNADHADQRNGRGFNPRSRTGSDSLSRPMYAAGCVLQSTLPHGERQGYCQQVTPPGQLQSTLPHGKRPNGSSAGGRVGCFNPRSRTGSDP